MNKEVVESWDGETEVTINYVKSSICVIKNSYTSFSELNTNFNILYKGVCYITKTNDLIKFFTILTKGSEVKNTKFLRY